MIHLMVITWVLMEYGMVNQPLVNMVKILDPGHSLRMNQKTLKL